MLRRAPALSAENKRFGDRFRLTPAECVVAALIAEARSVPEVAKDLSVSINTVRTHLRNVFAKTGVNRQSALVRLVVQAGHDR